MFLILARTVPLKLFTDCYYENWPAAILPLSPYSYLTARPSSQSTASGLSWTPNGQFKSCRYCTQEGKHTMMHVRECSHIFTPRRCLVSPSGRLGATLSWGCSSGSPCPRSYNVGSSGPPATRCSSCTVSHLSKEGREFKGAICNFFFFTGMQTKTDARNSRF